MSDIVERLRSHDDCLLQPIRRDVKEAADEIERQRAEIERLREALRKTACACSSTRDCPSPWPSDISGWCQHLNARMALEGKFLERKP